MSYDPFENSYVPTNQAWRQSEPVQWGPARYNNVEDLYRASSYNGLPSVPAWQRPTVVSGMQVRYDGFGQPIDD